MAWHNRGGQWHGSKQSQQYGNNQMPDWLYPAYYREKAQRQALEQQVKDREAKDAVDDTKRLISSEVQTALKPLTDSITNVFGMRQRSKDKLDADTVQPATSSTSSGSMSKLLLRALLRNDSNESSQPSPPRPKNRRKYSRSRSPQRSMFRQLMASMSSKGKDSKKYHEDKGRKRRKRDEPSTSSSSPPSSRGRKRGRRASKARHHRNKDAKDHKHSSHRGDRDSSPELRVPEDKEATHNKKILTQQRAQKIVFVIAPSAKIEELPDPEADREAWINAVANLTTKSKLDAIMQTNSISTSSTHSKSKKVELIVQFMLKE